MKVAFVGKGGSGKTTMSSLFARYLASQQLPVLAFDADINQHLAVSLAGSAAPRDIPPMGLEINVIKEYLRHNNPRISSNETMAKTTPPGRGSRLIRITESNPIFDHFARGVEGIRLLATGPFSEDDLGIKCYHSKVGAVELMLNHLIDGPNEYVVVDMTAGADSFASGMFTKFDLTVLVAEPTLKGLSVYKQYRDYAADYDIALGVVGNKVEDQADIEFLRDHVGGALIATMGRSNFVRSMEKGEHYPLSELEPDNLSTLETLRIAVDSQTKDWDKFYRQTIEFHKRNALSWANASAGEDLTKQIDPDFSFENAIQTVTT